MTLLNSETSIREVASFLGIECFVVIGTTNRSHPSIGEGNVCYFPTDGSSCSQTSANQRICCCGPSNTCGRVLPSSAPSKTPSKAPSKSPSRRPSKAPSKPPTPGGFCFSGENLISVLGKGEIRLDSLEIGDYVRSSQRGDSYYSRVYGFLHLHRQVPTDFLKFSFAKKSSLELEVTSEHLLYSKGKTIAASNVKVGDALDGQDGEALHVTGIETVKRNGVYAPATESGDIIISGVRASNYVNLLNASAMDQHTMSHAFMAPVRFVCKLHFDWCKQETYTKEEGYSQWVKYFVWIPGFLAPWGPGVQYFATLMISPLLSLLTVLDQISLQSLVAVGVSVAAYIGVHGKRKASPEK